MTLSQSNYQPTFEDLVSSSFYSFIEAYELMAGKKSNLFTIKIDILFQIYVKLCTMISGVFIFNTNDNEVNEVGFVHFTNVKGLMVGGEGNDGEMVEYKKPSNYAKLKAWLSKYQVLYNKPYFLLMMVTYCICYFVLGFGCTSLISFFGGENMIKATINDLNTKFYVLQNQVSQPTGPHTSALDYEMKEFLERQREYGYTDVYVPSEHSTAVSELSVEPVTALLERMHKNDKISRNRTYPVGFPVAKHDVRREIGNIDLAIGHALGGLKNLEGLSNAHNAYIYYLGMGEALGKKAQDMLTTTSNKYKDISDLHETIKKNLKEADKTRTYALNNKLEMVSNGLDSLVKYIWKGLTFQERESPFAYTIDFIGHIQTIYRLIGPTMTELSDRMKILNTGSEIGTSIMWLGIQIKFIVTTMIGISFYFSYKLVKSLNKLNQDSRINKDYKNLFMDANNVTSTLAFEVFKQIVRGEVSEPGKIETLIEGILEKKQNFATYNGPELTINFNSDEDKIFLGMAQMASKISEQNINQSFINFIMAHYEKFKKLNPEISNQSSMRSIKGPSRKSHYIESGGTKRKTKKSRKTKNPRKTRKTKKSRKTRKGSKRSNRKY